MRKFYIVPMLLKPWFLEIKLWNLKYDGESTRSLSQPSGIGMCRESQGELQQPERDTLAEVLQQLQARPEGVTVEAFSVEPLPTAGQRKPAAVPFHIVQHIQDVRNLILDYAMGAAILGLLPIPGFLMFEVQLVAAGVLVFKMILDIGAKWGYPKGQDVLAIAGNIFGCLGAFSMALMAWVAVFCVGLFVPFVGSMALASSLFTLTWTMGQVTSQFYASGRQIDAAARKPALQDGKKEGDAAYKANLAVLAQLSQKIATKQKAVESQLKELAEDLKADKITQQEYQAEIQEML